MATHVPTARVSAETRKLIAEMTMKGCRVKVDPDGTLTIDPPANGGLTVDPFEAVDPRA